MKTTFLYTIILLICLICNLNAQTKIGQTMIGDPLTERLGFKISMSDPNTIAVSGFFPYCFVKIYTKVGDFWVQKGQNLPGLDSTGWLLPFSGGLSMADANTVAIGRPILNGTTLTTLVKVYKWQDSLWVQKGEDFVSSLINDRFGMSISMPDSNTIAIGAPGPDEISPTVMGYARIYHWNGTIWSQKGGDIIGEQLGDNFGLVIDMPDTNTVAISALKNDSGAVDAGSVRVFSWSGANWIQKGQNIIGALAGDFIGSSLSMPDSNTIAIGGNNWNDNSDLGRVYVYKWSDSNWIQKGLKFIGASAGSGLGKTISMPDSNTIAIGEDYAWVSNGSTRGIAKVYEWKSNSWIQKGTDMYGETSNWYGYSVCMPNSYILATSGEQFYGTAPARGILNVFKLKGVYGTIFNDANINCVKENELGLQNYFVTINPGNIVATTDNCGSWRIDSLPVGNYTVTYNIPYQWRTNCTNNQSLTITDPNGIVRMPNFGLKYNYLCSKPEVTILMPFMRPCFTGQKVYVFACNSEYATTQLASSYVEVQLDTSLIVEGASMPYTDLGNNKLKFVTGTLPKGQCASFTIDCQVNCDLLLGETLCMEANLYPQASCVFDTAIAVLIPDDTLIAPWCSLPWDHSSLSVDGFCANDSIYFTITNTGSAGSGNMQCQAPVRVYVDDTLIYSFPIQLNGQQSVTYAYYGDGRTWILEADQHPLHPGNSHPNAHVEACGNITNWTPNLVNNLPLDDSDPIVDIYCGVTSSAYDPNDKTGFPYGSGTQHNILPNQQLQYFIRFQNTGTDTAFTIVVRDTLDTDLNIFSVIPGVASHDYSFRMFGPNVLEWTFDRILLPDSNINEPLSHGFFTFTVEQNKNLPIGTKIYNDADIYFDFNVPVITNETVHTINNQLHYYPVGITPLYGTQKSTIKVYPNPTKGSVYVELNEASPKTEVMVLNVLGQQISKQEFYNVSRCNLTIEGEPGVYFIKVVSGGKTEYVKLLKL